MSLTPRHPGPGPGPVRLLVVDVDGTLLTSGKRLTAAAAEAVVAAREAGLAVTLATGRMVEAVAHWIRDLGLRTPQIGNNGADILDPVTGLRLLHIAMAPAAVGLLLRFARRHDCLPVLFSGARVLAAERRDDLWLIERNNEPVELVSWEELLRPDREVEKALYLDRRHPERLPPLRSRLLGEIADGEPVPFDAQITEPGILNFCHPRATKIEAVRWLCGHLGIALSEVAAVGDGENDAALLGGVGLGIAMGNAAPPTRAAAAVTVADNDHGGVVQAIREVVLPRAGLAAASTG
ncbi:MAG: HAD hydrolase family protein, partial [Lentisphaeria bacterium]|nr:HAD hydrolase family protein [Lentisphaeria bacterium]